MDFRDIALIAELTVHMPGFRRRSKEAQDVITASFGTEDGAVEAFKRLIAQEHLKPVLKIINKFKGKFYKMTMPWGEGQRLIAKRHVGQLMQTYEEYRDQFDEEKNIFLIKYPELIEEARQRLGALFDESEFPSQDELADKMSMEVVVLPIQTDSQLDELGKEFGDALANVAKQELRSRYEVCLKTLINRFREHMEAAYKKLAEQREGERFRQALFDTLFMLAESIGDFAVQDKELKSIAAEVARVQIDLQLIKEDPEEREKKAKQLQGILDKMKIWEGHYGQGN